MSNIRNWSTSPGSNSSAPPMGAPEGMAPSTLNNTMRQQMADHRTQWQDGQWFDWGDTPSYASATTFKIATDVTSRYEVGRRLKLYDASTLYASITASSYSAPDTTVTIALDSGTPSASLTSIALSVLTNTNSAIPAISNLSVSGTSSLSGAVVMKTNLSVEGTSTLSSAVVMKTNISVEGTSTLSGAVTFKTAITSPTLVTPVLGIPTSGTLTNCTGYTDANLSLTDITTNNVSTSKHGFAPKGDGTTTKFLNANAAYSSPFVIQQVRVNVATSSTGTTAIPQDNTIPQSNEGDQFMSLAITPTNASSVLTIDVVTFTGHSASAGLVVAALFQDSNASASACGCGSWDAAGRMVNIRFSFSTTAGTTSATTFKVRIGGDTGSTTTFNGAGGNRNFGGALFSSITITESTA